MLRKLGWKIFGLDLGFKWVLGSWFAMAYVLNSIVVQLSLTMRPSSGLASLVFYRFGNQVLIE